MLEIRYIHFPLVELIGHDPRGVVAEMEIPDWPVLPVGVQYLWIAPDGSLWAHKTVDDYLIAPMTLSELPVRVEIRIGAKYKTVFNFYYEGARLVRTEKLQ